MQTELHKLNI
ncbi:hypothetical protein CGLO_18057 [Colletotrichum gloeosporioides Cg-14]|uniref:Uncharacterized protein n=1 Tax=Colletotrichum gloeosporioides (strain Cg-14) TaxID=1237896 RepID=T0JS38_COLGC|nr:hypothetical protein CGLO_18057 [Colletotrichum gloeosporioides Cg-14]